MDFKRSSRVLAPMTALFSSLLAGQSAIANENQDNFEQEIDLVCEDVFQNEDPICFDRTLDGSTVTAQITPDEEPALYTSLLQISGAQLNNVSSHLVGMRRQRNAGGGATAFTGADYLGGNAGGELFSSGRLSAFFSGSQTDGSQDDTDYEIGYDLATDHYTLGIDLQLNPEWLVGFAYGNTETELEYSGDFGDQTDNDSDHFLLYSSWYRRSFALDMTLGYASGEFKTQRTLPDAVAYGKTDQDMMYLSIAGAFDFSQGGMTYGPIAKLDYLDGQIDGFSEEGDSSWNAEFDDQDVKSMIYSLGAQVSYAHSFSWGVIVPYAQGFWRYEFEDERDLIVGRFSISPSDDFTITPDEPDTTWFELSAGVSAVFPYGIAAFISYEEVVSYEDTDLYTVSAGARLEF